MIQRKLLQLVVAIAVTLIFSTHTKAQVFCPPGATWYYTTDGQLSEGYTKFSYVSDTIIKSITCKKLTHYYKFRASFGVFEKEYSPLFVYSENGVTYQYQYNDNHENVDSDKFDTIYNINAKIGDKWILPQTDTLCPDSMYRMEVLNTGTKTINGFNLKWLYVKIGAINMGGENSFYVFDTITEHVGLLNKSYEYLHRCPGMTESGEYRLRCYSDDVFGNYSTGISKGCDYITGIKESKRDKIYIGLYPNPANDKINIQLYSPQKGTIELRIYDVTGRLLQQTTFSKDIEITTGLLDAGVYTYTCTMNGEYLQSGKISVIH